MTRERRGATRKPTDTHPSIHVHRGIAGHAEGFTAMPPFPSPSFSRRAVQTSAPQPRRIGRHDGLSVRMG